MKKNQVSFLEVAWLFGAFSQLDHFTLWAAIPLFFLFPYWKDLRLWADTRIAWKKLNKQDEIDKIAKEVEDEQKV